MHGFKDRFRDRRLELGLTQTRVADAMGRTKAAVSHWELGTAFPGKDVYEPLARMLHVDVGWLIFGTHELRASGVIELGLSISGGGTVVPSRRKRLVPVPPALIGQKVAVYEVESFDLSPRIEPGDIIYTTESPVEPPSRMIGRDAVVAVAGGRFLRRVEPSPEPGRFTLTSPNSTPMANVQVLGVYPVVAVVKAVALELFEFVAGEPVPA